MPRTNLCRDLKKEKWIADTKEFLRANIGKNDLNKGELADKCGIARTTFYDHTRNPEDMRLGELWKIIDTLDPDEYYLKMLVGLHKRKGTA